MATANLSFPDTSYSSTNKPSVTTLKTDLTTLETTINALDDDNIAAGANIDGDKIENATTAVKGTSSFDEDSFVVISGDVKPEFIGAKAYMSASMLNIVDNTWTECALDTEVYDIGSNFDTGVGDYKFVAPVDGYYEMSGQVNFIGLIADKKYDARIWDGTNVLAFGSAHSSSTSSLAVPLVTVRRHLSANDEVVLNARANSIGGNTVDIEGTVDYNTFLEVRLIAKD